MDVVVSGSQKAFMLPPGLAFVSVSPKAWACAEKITAPCLYLNLKAYRKSLADNDVPYTPAITLIRGLKVALDMILGVGIEKVWARTALLAKAAATIDTAERSNLLEQAEKLMLEDLPIIPLYHYATKSLVSDRVKGWKFNLRDVHPSRFIWLVE